MSSDKTFEQLSATERLDRLNQAVNADAAAHPELAAHPNLVGRYALIVAREALFIERASQGSINPRAAFDLAERIALEGVRVGLAGAGVVPETELRTAARQFDPNTLLG